MGEVRETTPEDIGLMMTGMRKEELIEKGKVSS
jgi:hypothetical protein